MTTMKKRVLILLSIALFFMSLDSFAQYYNNGMSEAVRRQRQVGPTHTEERKSPKDITTTTGLFLFDVDQVIKKCKISNKAKQDSIKAYFGEYLLKMDNLRFEFMTQLNAISTMNEKYNNPKAQNQPMSEADKTTMSLVRKYMSEIANKTSPIHIELYNNVKSLLNEKEAKRWRLHYQSVCEDNFYFNREITGKKKKNDDEGSQEEGEKPMGKGNGGPKGGKR